jgi:hypothetical protein
VPKIEPFYVTFGVRYSNDPDRGERHPLGFTKDNYIVIEAPDFAMAQRIAQAILGDKYAFIYDYADFMEDGTFDRWYNHDGAHALTIKWAVPSPAVDVPPIIQRDWEQA